MIMMIPPRVSAFLKGIIPSRMYKRTNMKLPCDVLYTTDCATHHGRAMINRQVFLSEMKTDDLILVVLSRNVQRLYFFFFR